MQPAYSVIFFTVSSGAGYGLLIWLALAVFTNRWELNALAGLAGAGLALVLVSAGLMSSTFHLGHPERSWRAFTPWRTSWLSREAVFAVLTYIPALVLAAGWLMDDISGDIARGAAAATVLLAAATVMSTGMIYASLKPIPRWHNVWVVPVYLLMALASGTFLFLVLLGLSGIAAPSTLWRAIVLIVIAWAAKIGYWHNIGKRDPTSTAESVTGLGNFGEVSLLEGPHTSDNFVMREMGYSIARRHATRLRRIAVTTGGAAPVTAIVLSIVSGDWLAAPLLSVGAVTGLIGVVIERWLFFAEAQHVVTLYYGERQV